MWDADRWQHVADQGESGFHPRHWGGHLVGPLSAAERAEVERKTKNARPGPTCWKVRFLPPVSSMVPRGVLGVDRYATGVRYRRLEDKGGCPDQLA